MNSMRKSKTEIIPYSGTCSSTVEKASQDLHLTSSTISFNLFEIGVIYKNYFVKYFFSSEIMLLSNISVITEGIFIAKED